MAVTILERSASMSVYITHPKTGHYLVSFTNGRARWSSLRSRAKVYRQVFRAYGVASALFCSLGVRGLGCYVIPNMIHEVRRGRRRRIFA
jgi:hypothetical protein